MFEKFLEEIGLSDKEAKVYSALLEVENDSVLDLSKKTGVNRTTIYPVLESLSKKGLISEVKIDKKVRFAAEAPERLETYVERQKIKLEEQSKKLKDIIPQMKSVQREEGEKPIVKYYEGRNGIYSSTEELFSTRTNEDIMYFIYSKDIINEVFSKKELDKLAFTRISKNITSKSIYNFSEGEISLKSKGNRIRIDEKKYPISCDICIYGDVVRISTLGESLSSFLIKSKDFANTLKSIIDHSLDNKK